MSADSQGNDTSKVPVIVTGAIMLVPYSEDNMITPEMIDSKIATPTLPEAYNRQTACVGLITSDGAPQDARDAEDSTEFWQNGYMLNGDSTLSMSFTIAEDNELTRRITLGEPDEHGVYHVEDIIQGDKWCAYYEETLKGGRVRRRAGVVQITGNEPGQRSRGTAIGDALTVTWQPDAMYGGAKYLQSVYETTGGTITKVELVSTTGDTAPASVNVGDKKEYAAKATYDDENVRIYADGTATFDSSDPEKAKFEGNVLTGVSPGSTQVTARIGSVASQPVEVTVSE